MSPDYRRFGRTAFVGADGRTFGPAGGPDCSGPSSAAEDQSSSADPKGTILGVQGFRTFRMALMRLNPENFEGWTPRSCLLHARDTNDLDLQDQGRLDCGAKLASSTPDLMAMSGADPGRDWTSLSGRNLDDYYDDDTGSCVVGQTRHLANEISASSSSYLITDAGSNPRLHHSDSGSTWRISRETGSQI